MGLTLIRKSGGRPRKRRPKISLVLAGGAVSGGAFKVGGLKALNDFFVGDRNVNRFDSYVGISAGSLLSVPLAAGISPDEMVRVLEGTSQRFTQLRPIDFYTPNTGQFVGRPARFVYDFLTYFPGISADIVRALPELPSAVATSARRFLRRPTYTHFEAFWLDFTDHLSPDRRMPALMHHLPTGLFDSAGLELWLRKNLERIRVANDFQAFERRFGRQLYISACDLDTAERVIFGADEQNAVSISQAVQASAAVPGFYKPARIHGIDYVDGGVRNTANIDVAIDKGADLVICYNPFRPFLNRIDDESDAASYFADGRYLSDRGIGTVMNQVFRTMLHSRLSVGIQRYVTDERFQGDIVLLEPREQDANFFAMNPLAFWKRAEAVQHGFESVRQTIEQNFEELSDVLGRYGLAMSRETARRRARRLRSGRGWQELPPDEQDAVPPLRVVEI